MGRRRYYLCPTGIIQVKDLPAQWGLLWAEKGQVIIVREARGCPERNLVAEVRFLSAMLRRAQVRIGTRPLSEWLRGENRLEAKRGIPPNLNRPPATHPLSPPRNSPLFGHLGNASNCVWDDPQPCSKKALLVASPHSSVECISLAR